MLKQIEKVQFSLLVIILLQALCAEAFTIRTSLVHQNKVSSSTTQPYASSIPHASISPLFNAIGESNNEEDLQTLPTYGGLIGKITGLSLTVIRKSIRTTTGLSITAFRTALRGLTGVSVTGSMKMLFGIFPPKFRYFLQPFFIMYYTPLMIIKYFIGSTKTSKEEAYAAHELIVEGWKDAIQAAEVVQESWPLHVTDDGNIESLTPQSVPITDAIVESLDIASTVRQAGNNN
jgi:hypothetical protein